MKEWDKQGALSNLDYRATGPFCMFGKGKAMLKIFNQTTQYLITRDKAISFIQPNAVRSLPIGFSNQNDLLLAYSNTTGNTFSVGSLTDKGDIESVPEQNSYHINQLKGKIGSLPGRCN